MSNTLLLMILTLFNAEIYPLWARSNCYALSTSFNWFFNFFVSVSFLSLASAVTKQGAFYIYLVISILGWLFTYFMLPETSGRPLEEVERLFMLPRKERMKIKPGQSLSEALANSQTYNTFSDTGSEIGIRDEESSSSPRHNQVRISNQVSHGLKSGKTIGSKPNDASPINGPPRRSPRHSSGSAKKSKGDYEQMGSEDE